MDGEDATASTPLTLLDIQSAARRIRGHILRTPLRSSRWLSDATGGEILLKLETLQPTFSYKVRGAFNAVARIREERNDARLRIVTASAGNHGQALALAARWAGVPLTVFIPENAPRTKLEALRASGAELRACRDYDDAERSAKESAARGEGLFISPYNHPDIIAGAGSVGLEILEDRPDLDVVVVPVGGGGLISGIAVAVHAISPGASTIGVEVAASSPFTRGLAAGRVVAIDVQPTLADGLAGNLDPDTITFAIVQNLVARIVLASEAELHTAIAGVASHERLIVEGAGAVGVAAVLARKLDLSGRRAAIVLSGANIDPDVLRLIV